MRRTANIALIAVVVPVALLTTAGVGFVGTVLFETHRAKEVLRRATDAALVGKRALDVEALLGPADRISSSRLGFVHPSEEPPDEFVTTYEYWALPYRALVAFEVYCERGVVTYIKVDD